MSFIIEAKGIAKQFHRERGECNIFYPVQKTDFLVDEGEIAVLSGYSGSGKTTLLNMISGILPPTEGSVLFEGKNIYEMTDCELSLFRNENIGSVPQGQTALHSLTVLENVLLPYTLYGKDKETYLAKEKYAKELLEKLQILSLESVMPSELSGGELRRVAVARSLIMQPKVIFADEPTSDLDELNTEIVVGLFKEIAKTGTSIVISTHDKDFVKFANSSYVMKDGVLEKQI